MEKEGVARASAEQPEIWRSCLLGAEANAITVTGDVVRGRYREGEMPWVSHSPTLNHQCFLLTKFTRNPEDK
jgi:hypothetical protein